MKVTFKRLAPFGRAMATSALALLLLSAMIGVLDRAGLRLIYPEIGPVLFLAALVVLAVWGAVALQKKIRSRALQTMARMALALVILTVSMLSLTALLNLMRMSYPRLHRTIAMSDGTRIAILKKVDLLDDYEAALARMELRREALLAQSDGETAQNGAEDAYPEAAFGYGYTACPRRLSIFLDTRHMGEGAVYLGCRSHALLVLQEETEPASIEIDDPEPGDEGRIILIR